MSSVLPPGSENLKGYEVEMIIRFKEALGIDDPDAASVHVEVIISFISLFKLINISYVFGVSFL